MNSLNIISARVSPSSSPVPSRTNSLGSLGLAVKQATERDQDGDSAPPVSDTDTLVAEPDDSFPVENPHADDDEKHRREIDEHTPLLNHAVTGFKNPDSKATGWLSVPKRIATSFINSIRWVLSALAAPGVYLIACLYDDAGNFAPLLRLTRSFGGRRKGQTYGDVVDEKARELTRPATRNISGRPTSVYSSSSGVSSESESDRDASKNRTTAQTSSSSRGQHSRSKSLQPTEEIAPSRRSIRIKLHSEDSLRQRKHKKSQSSSGSSSHGGPNDISAQLKSPTSPVGALTKYPRTPAPPRPLIPRRQPSYVNAETADLRHQKTLILDLDETLIHSMSKGGRMSTGHMVEVRLATTYVGVGGQASIGPQHPILYYVHKRPHCDDFLRRVCKWYNLVIFTASVQEYADPVIDWLESERKFFSARYYRQHCTFRHGAFIKDLSSVEPDLSKVMILDNSPLSYMFHQDNAIPIQGWINDPTDNDLLHLVPMLEGLQYVSDVRALLALRGGEDGQHMA
ncbi:dullard-like phosphatase domain-containing protein [Coniochaeta sp. 2T2.1]|nr:dullard-like phosphatase domain-containing protein [Coniochaeta sp. 2T2.1]